MGHKPLLAVVVALAAPSVAASQPCSPSAPPCSAAELRDSERLAAAELVTVADGSRGERARIAYRDAGSRFLLVWQTYFADACRGKDAACIGGEEVLYNAARAFQAAHDVDRASAVRGTLFDPQFHLERTALAHKALRQEGLAQQALTEYAKAADLFERFSKAAPREEEAAPALLDAIVLRLAVHDRPAAEQNAEQWSKLYAAKSPADHAGIVMALAESKRDGGATPRELEAYLSANRDTVAKAQSEHQPRIDVMLGEAVLARGDLGAARLHFSRAAAYDVLPLIERLREEDSALGDRRLGRALMAMGDAKLWLADQARDAAMKLVIRKADADSLQKKRAAVAEAEKLYGEIPALQPVPPPTSTVEAAARVARMRGQLWAQAHLALGAEAAEPMLADAQMAYRMCVSLGAKFQVVTPGSRACAAWLTRHFPSESPRLGEIMPSPKWSGLRFGPPVPLDRDGEPPAVKSR